MLLQNGAECVDEKRPILKESRQKSSDTQDSYTVDEGLQTVGVSRYQYRFIGLIFLCSLAQGTGECLPLMTLDDMSCRFTLTSSDKLLILLFIHIGNMIGNVIGGSTGDHHGRRSPLLFSMWVLSGTLPCLALCPWAPALTLLLLISGVAAGAANTLLATYVAEFSLPCIRSTVNTISFLGWTSGALYVTCSAYFLLDDWNFRTVSLVCSMPVIAVAWLAHRLDEPVKFLGITDQASAVLVLEQMAEENGTSLPEKELRVHVPTKAGSVSELFTRYPSPTILFLLISLVGGMTYGVTYSSSPVLSSTGDCKFGKEQDNGSCSTPFPGVIDLCVVIVAELMIAPVTSLSVDFVGRLPIMRSVTGFILLGCLSSMYCYTGWITSFIQCIRRSLSSDLNMLLSLYVPENYPTFIRGTATGLILGTFHFGTLLLSLLSNTVDIRHLYHVMKVVIIVLALVAFICNFHLRKETVGMCLNDTRDEEEEAVQGEECCLF